MVTAEEFVGIELFVPGFEGERKRSTRPAMQALTAGTVRACIHDPEFRDHFPEDRLLSTPHLYFSPSQRAAIGAHENHVTGQQRQVSIGVCLSRRCVEIVQHLRRLGRAPRPGKSCE